MSTYEVFLDVSLILLMAKVAGYIVKRLNQPAVFGELLIGIIIGPSILNIIKPNEYLELLAHIGVVMLMFIAGLETEFEEVKRVRLPAIYTAIMGVIMPAGLGFITSIFFNYDIQKSVFVGIVLTATSVSITAQTLLELGRLRTKEGTTILSAAIIDDVLGILALSIVVALFGIGSEQENIFATLLRMSLFFIISIFVGLKVIPYFFKKIVRLPIIEGVSALCVVICLLYAWFAESFGRVASITGAYIAGVIIGNSVYKKQVEEKIHTITYSLFAPLFFVSIGLETEIKALTGLVLFTSLITIMAIVGKVLGCGLGALAGGCRFIEALRIGVGMMSRGEVALIISSIGLSSKLLDIGLFSAMIVMILITTCATPPLLKYLFNISGKKINYNPNEYEVINNK